MEGLTVKWWRRGMKLSHPIKLSTRSTLMNFNESHINDLNPFY